MMLNYCFILVTLLALLLPSCVEPAPKPLLETQKLDEPLYLSWKDKENRTLDLIFSSRKKLDAETLRIPRVNLTLLTEALIKCNGHSACLIEDRNSILNYDLSASGSALHYDLAGPPIQLKANDSSSLKSCKSSRITVNQYCSPHWNPPIHILKNNCNHNIDWHSPKQCPPKKEFNSEHGCYTYDSQGNLYDLTRLMDNNDYSVEVHNEKFFIAVCNTHKFCGDEAAICSSKKEQRFIYGFNNQTNLVYDETREQLNLTLLGPINQNCKDNQESRIRTTINFICSTKLDGEFKPKYLSSKSSECEKVFQWETTHACQASETTNSATDCGIFSDRYGFKVNMTEQLNNNLRINGSNNNDLQHDVLLSFCQPLRKEYNCGGSKTPQTIACLIDHGADDKKLNEKNSKIIGLIAESTWVHQDGHVYWKSKANQKCNTTAPMNDGIVVDFVCDGPHQDIPKYIGSDDCNYHFEWSRPWKGICHLNPEVIEQEPRNTANETQLRKPSEAKDYQKVPLDHSTEESAQVKHEKNINESQKMMENHASPSPAAEPKIISANKGLAGTEMNKWHRAFMIGLVILSLTAFFAAIVILDRKTRFRLTLRRQARHPYPRSVPYNRIDNDLNDGLDL